VVTAVKPAALVLTLAAALAPDAALADADDKGGRSGREVYEAVCSQCHGTGHLNAPRFGDAGAWKKLIAEGQRSLVRTALRGIRQMPPRGGNPGL
jgi:cytochrome c5